MARARTEIHNLVPADSTLHTGKSQYYFAYSASTTYVVHLDIPAPKTYAIPLNVRQERSFMPRSRIPFSLGIEAHLREWPRRASHSHSFSCWPAEP